jgi:RNA polymerase sigma-70 factor (ECF subfamily)
MEPCVVDAATGLMATPRRDVPAGIDQIVEHYGERVYRLALRITGVPEDAEEVVEDALRTAVRTVHTFTDEPAFASWIVRMVARAAHQKRQQRQPGNSFVMDGVLPPLDADGHFEPMDDWSARIDEPALRGQLSAVFADAIDALPTDCRTVLILHDVEGASKRNIAEVLHVEEPAVASLVHRARLFVRQRLSQYFESSNAGIRDSVNRSAGARHLTG